MPNVTIRRRLAVGGMAEVFLAERARPDGGTEPCVVKRLLPGADPAWTRLFAREREALGRVDSPHVVRLLDAGDDHLVLEYVDGPDLATLLLHQGRRGRPLALPAALAVLDGMLRGLEDLHAATDATGRPLGLVHRDVGPSNVLLSRGGDVKLADLGVVRVGASGEPTTVGLKGTLAYMAPEQLAGRVADLRADLYAFGLVAYEVLTGAPARPPGNAGLAELLDARSRRPAPPSALRPELPRALDEVVLEALDPDPAARPESAGALRERLLAGAGAAPDPAALAAAVAEVAASPEPAGRTLAPREPSESAVETAPAPVTAWPLVALGGAIAALAAISFLAISDITIGAAEGAEAVSSPGVLRGPDVAAVVEPDTASPTDAAADASPAPPDAAPAPPSAGPGDAGAATAVADVAAAPPPASDAGPAPLDAAEPAEAPRFKLEIGRYGDREVHVKGAGAAGLAPLTTGVLGEGAHVFELTGDHGNAKATLRVVRRGSRLDATIGASGRWYSVNCAGRDLGTTPVTEPVGRRLRCRLTGEDGAELGFDLRPVSAW